MSLDTDGRFSVILRGGRQRTWALSTLLENGRDLEKEKEWILACIRNVMSCDYVTRELSVDRDQGRFLEELTFKQNLEGWAEIRQRVGLPSWLSGKNLPASEWDVGSIPESGRFLKEEMAPHSSILAWKIAQTEEPGGLQSVEWQKNQTWLSNEKNNSNRGRERMARGKALMEARVWVSEDERMPGWWGGGCRSRRQAGMR